jgi:hypothetical protein
LAIAEVKQLWGRASQKKRARPCGLALLRVHPAILS